MTDWKKTDLKWRTHSRKLKRNERNPRTHSRKLKRNAQNSAGNWRRLIAERLIPDTLHWYINSSKMLQPGRKAILMLLKATAAPCPGSLESVRESLSIPTGFMEIQEACFSAVGFACLMLLLFCPLVLSHAIPASGGAPATPLRTGRRRYQSLGCQIP